jgi:hypothetical protein
MQGDKGNSDVEITTFFEINIWAREYPESIAIF